MDELRGRAAVVTGGGSGIGRGLCLTWADEGMDVVVADIDKSRADEVAEEVRVKGVRAVPVACDVSDASSVEALADNAYAEFGSVGVVCNNAGVLLFRPATESTREDWDWLFGVNLFGVVNGVRAFVPRMRGQDAPAHIVNTASIAGLTSGNTHLAVYSASKYAVVSLSDSLRSELSTDGIGVSVLCPGGVRTNIASAARGDIPASMADPSERTPLDTAMDPLDVAGLVRDAVKANRFYVMTHAAGRDSVARRFAEVDAAFDFAVS